MRQTTAHVATVAGLPQVYRLHVTCTNDVLSHDAATQISSPPGFRGTRGNLGVIGGSQDINLTKILTRISILTHFFL
jgi:hypothetical protein